MFKMKLDIFMWSIIIIILIGLHCYGLSYLPLLITSVIIDFIIIIFLIILKKRSSIKNINRRNYVESIEDEEYGESHYSEYSESSAISYSDIIEQDVNPIIETPTIIKKSLSNKERIDMLTLDESSQNEIIQKALSKWRKNE